MVEIFRPLFFVSGVYDQLSAIFSCCRILSNVVQNKQGETAAFEDASHLPLTAFKNATLYTTLSPCPMCAGAALFFKVKRVVIADNKNMGGSEEYLRSQGVEVIVINSEDCISMMADFIKMNPDKW